MKTLFLLMFYQMQELQNVERGGQFSLLIDLFIDPYLKLKAEWRNG